MKRARDYRREAWVVLGERYLLLIPAAFVPCGTFAQLFLQPYVQTACAAF